MSQMRNIFWESGRLIFQDILRAFRIVSENIRNDIYAGFVETYLFRARLSPIVQYSIIIDVLRNFVNNTALLFLGHKCQQAGYRWQ